MSERPWTPGPVAACSKCGQIKGSNADRATAEANARLIAAGPELAEALAETVAVISDMGDDADDLLYDAHEKALAVLKKAGWPEGGGR
jgi:hypothetical protein